MNQQDLNTLFQTVYANLPLNARKEIVVVVDNEPLTWSAAKVEIDSDTAKGKEILRKLIAMKIIKND